MNFFGKVIGFFKKKEVFPSNILITAPHGSARVPLLVFRKLSIYYKTSPRLLLNFSDYGTKYLVEKFPENQKIIPKHGRLIGDPNRSPAQKDIIRFEDFNGNKIFTEKFEKKLTTSIFRFFWKRKILNYSYNPFYKEVYEKLAKMVKDPKNEQKPIILIDVHDVGNRLLGRYKKEDSIREKKFPKVVLANAPDLQTSKDQFGTAPDYFIKSFAKILAENMEIKTSEIKINYIYKGGNIIKHFGNPFGNVKLRKIMNGKEIFAIQIEFNRGLYLNEINQRPYSAKIKLYREALMETLKKLGKFDI